MTPEAQRIAIAEAHGTLACPACGWDQIKCNAHDYEIPDYLNDLNAMHEAEKVLGREQIHKFLTELEHIVIRDQEFLPTVSWLNWLCIHAIAAQRAEAFLRTLNLWTD